MRDDARVDAAVYRGFLFSDMRGFTTFAERYGNSAAAEAVGRFLELARTAIARYDGAEIKTEGDAIHAVFPSASGAVLCGLDIVAAAAELSAQRPDRPLHLGVGVHAGEAVETAEGYIGRAVNIAARLCAVALPGEVLVSSTVKGIAQASIQVAFIPRGQRRLKGIADPILVYAVTRDMSAQPAPRGRRPQVLGAVAIAIVGLVGIAVLAGSRLLPAPTADPSATAAGSASAAPSSQPLAIGPLAIGAYRSSGFTPPVTFDIVDQGWTANRDRGDVLGLIRDTEPLGSVHFLRVGAVIAQPCVEHADTALANPGAAAVLSELATLEHVALSDPRTIEVGGHTGQQVDVTISEGALAACGSLAGGEVALFDTGGEVWRASPGERFKLVSVDVGDAAVTIVVSTDWSSTRSIKEMEDLFALGQRIVESVGF